MALGEGDVYSQENSLIKNIFSNNSRIESDLVGIYVFQVLTKGNDVLIDETHINKIGLGYLQSALSRIFDIDEQQAIIGKKIEEFCSDKWEICEIQRETNDMTSEPAFMMLPRGAVLWNDLRRRSFLVEFFRDDTYIPISSQDDKVWPLIFKPAEGMDIVDRVGSILRFVDSYASKELSLFARKQSQGELGWLRENIGTSPVCARMEEGVSKSLRRIFPANISGTPKEIRQAHDLVKLKVAKVCDFMISGDSK